MPLPTLTPELIIIGGITSVAAVLLSRLQSAPEKAFKHIRGWFRRKFFYKVTIYPYDELFYILEAHLFRNYERQYKDVEASVEWMADQNNSAQPTSEKETIQQDRKIHYKQEENVFIIRYMDKKFMVQKEKVKEDKAVSSLKDRYFRHYTITGIRCKKEINNFLEVIFREHENSKPKGSINIHVSSRYGDWDRFDGIRPRALNQICLPKNTRTFIEHDLDEFIRSEAWYAQTGIPYKRGYCFHGAPGNGKTSMSLAFGAHLKRDIYTLNVNTLEDDGSLHRAFVHLRRNAILLIEDIDRSFVQRDNKGSKISFSALLNCLDGAMSRHGLIVIITTNHIELLDPALLREGRMDVKLAINNPDNRMIGGYLSLFYQTTVQLSNGSPENISLSMAAVQEICVRNKEDMPAACREIARKINLADSPNLRILHHQTDENSMTRIVDIMNVGNGANEKKGSGDLVV